MNRDNLLLKIDKHIELVGNNIDIICNNITINNNYNIELDKITLIDLILCVANNNMLPKVDRVFTSINNNTYMNYPFVYNIDNIISELQIRKQNHDKSLYEEYKNIENYEELLQSHYKLNRHHIEYFQKGIYEMNIIDIIEMFCDWYAISDNIYNYIDSKEEKIHSKSLVKVLKNTVFDIFEQK